MGSKVAAGFCTRPVFVAGFFVAGLCEAGSSKLIQVPEAGHYEAASSRHEAGLTGDNAGDNAGLTEAGYKSRLHFGRVQVL